MGSFLQTSKAGMELPLFRGDRRYLMLHLPRWATDCLKRADPALAQSDKPLVLWEKQRGAMRVGISSTETDATALLDRVRSADQMTGADLSAEVSTSEAYVVPAAGDKRFTVVALDLGIKANTPRMLAERGIETHVLPSTATLDDVLALEPDGLFCSNGPGDPATLPWAVANVQALLGEVPVFGICLGHQLLATALGGRTEKLPFGHHGGNHPVRRMRDGVVEITSQNHNFAVAEGSLDRAEVTHVNLNDGVIEGIRALDVPAFSVQHHPEAGPGPHDSAYLFDDFVELMRATGARGGAA